MEREGVSDEMGGVTDGKVLAFGGAEVQFPIFRPDGAAFFGVLENIMAGLGNDEFDITYIEEAVC